MTVFRKHEFMHQKPVSEVCFAITTCTSLQSDHSILLHISYKAIFLVLASWGVGQSDMYHPIGIFLPSSDTIVVSEQQCNKT